MRRRSVLRGGSALVAAPTIAATAPALSEPLLRFGLIADPQYSPAPPWRETRYFSHSLWKLSEAFAFLNKQDLAFVATLGDIINKEWVSYAHVLPIYQELQHPHHFVLGNHDYSVADEYLHAVPSLLGLQRSFYDFAVPGFRFLVVDGNEIGVNANAPGSPRYRQGEATIAALREAGAPNGERFNGGMGQAQLAWLKAKLAAAADDGEIVFIFGHFPAYPLSRFTMFGHEAFLDVVTEAPAFVAYFNGHDHAGNYARFRGKHFVNLKGMVDTPAWSAYAIVEVYVDRLEIRGFGREPDRTLAI